MTAHKKGTNHDDDADDGELDDGFDMRHKKQLLT